jgi:hypothetical protein
MFELILILVIALPLAWFVSEFTGPTWVRTLLGIAAIASSFGVAFIFGSLQQWNYNIWYGEATSKLVDETSNQLKAGNTEAVINNLQWLESQYRPTYENRANYDQLVESYVARFENPE